MSFHVDIQTDDRASAVRLLQAFVSEGFTPFCQIDRVPTQEYQVAFRRVVLQGDLPPLDNRGELCRLAWPQSPNYLAVCLCYEHELLEGDSPDQPEWITGNPGWNFHVGLRKGRIVEDHLMLLNLVRVCRQAGPLHRVAMFDSGTRLYATIDGPDVRAYERSESWTPAYLQAFGL